MKIQSPLDGKPTTHDLIDSQGVRRMAVIPRELTPFRAILADFLAIICALGFIVFLIADPYDTPIPNLFDLPKFIVWLLILLGGTCATYLASKYTFRHELLKETIIELTPEYLKIKTLFSFKCYDRKIPHKFILLQHDNTQNEQRRNDIRMRRASMEGRMSNPAIYYGDSYHVVFEYMGQRVDIMDVYGQKPARAILARLMLCDQLMDNQLKGSNGATLRIEDQWKTQPGEIIEGELIENTGYPARLEEPSYS